MKLSPGSVQLGSNTEAAITDQRPPGVRLEGEKEREGISKPSSYNEVQQRRDGVSDKTMKAENLAAGGGRREGLSLSCQTLGRDKIRTRQPANS
ncbi:hypothetical protein CRG98_044037 [Punica granatum]|uniref:Uncharacterized protein n=1 Tax=Punica granatum TaxID=22663 RepID=A0A2I0HVC7_PUNGR|nr:hypothetical protein CRG98_044037 [Punica granatum]